MILSLFNGCPPLSPSLLTFSFSLLPSYPFLPHSLPPSIPHSLTHSLPHSLTHSLPPSLTPVLTHSLPPSLAPLPHSLTNSLPPSLTHPLPPSVPPSLTPSLPSSPSLSLPFPPSLLPSLPPSLTHSLTHSSPSLPPSPPLQVYREIKRQSHISAEQRRRGTIKQGFDQLQTIVVDPSSYPSGKISKATVLGKSQLYSTFILLRKVTGKNLHVGVAQ